jgi:putative ABC transport system permease protein
MKLKSPFDREHSERELSEELQFHLEREVQNNLAQGMSEEDARRQARLSFGPVDAVKDDCRELRFGSWFEATLRDVLYGMRLLRKSPGFAIIAVAILAVGIGANTAIFSTVNAVLLSRWPFPHPEKIVMIAEGSEKKPTWTRISVPNFEDYQRDQRTFDQLAMYLGQSINLTGQDRPDRLIGSFVSANYFDVFGAKPALGRLFVKGEDQPGAANVAVLSHEVWQTRFGADPSIVGRQLTLNNETYSVIGVLPGSYRLPFYTDVYLTAQHFTSYRRDRAAKGLLVIGRVKENVTLQQAESDLDTIAQRLARDYPKENTGIRIAIADFRDLLNRSLRTPLIVLLGSVGLLLLITCANLGSLLLARGVQRRQEMAVRLALGAKRSRIIRQLICETMLIAVIGGAAGVLLGFFMLPLLVRLAPSALADVNAGIDLRVLLFSVLLTLLTGVIFAIVPAIQLSRVNLAPGLNSAVRGAAQAVTGAKARAAFVIFQVAISLVLLVGAGLMIRSFKKMILSDTGMSTSQLLTMEYRLPPNKYAKPGAQEAFHRQLAERVAQVPGVVSSAIVEGLPFSGNYGHAHYAVAGEPVPEKGKEPGAFSNEVTPGYFSTVGIPLLRGRNFNDQDGPTTPLVVVVSRSLATRHWANQDPLGKTLQLTDADPDINGKALTIVGVVGDAKQIGARDSDLAEIYFPYSQASDIFGTLVVRTAGDPMSFAEAVRQAVWTVDRDQPVWKVRTLQFLIERDLEDERLLMALLTSFGALAVLLTALGTYGVLSSVVNQRRQEIGIRMALGADRAAVRNMILLQGIRLALAGAVLGIIAAAAASRILASQLYGVGMFDGFAYATAWLLMLVIAFVASYLPARRAMRVDPGATLRYE